MSEPAVNALPATVITPALAEPSYEQRLPQWQQWLNATCENWIFAFIVAMAIRHFCLEAFRIPTASMEPMLYGDPAFSKSDHVVVDKFLFRFTGPKRWDVTVFQFPQPEIEGGADARPAIDADDQRLDMPMVKPLMYRNFVKRAVILPKDRFYIFGGNIYLQQSDGSWAVSRKPTDVQEALWQEIYHHGDQPLYLPWQGEGASTVKAEGSRLAFDLHDGDPVRFTQPFRNLYLKPGTFRIRPFHPGDDDPLVSGGMHEEQSELLDVSMTRPMFTHRATGRTGSAWEMDQWAIHRLTSADLDSNAYGVLLNQTMREWIGDVRMKTGISLLTGNVTFQLSQGAAHHYELTIDQSGWKLSGDGKPLKAGSEVMTGKPLEFTHLDDQVLVKLAGQVLWSGDVPAVDPNLERLSLRLTGSGSVTLAMLSIDRDVHYTSTMKGCFLDDETAYARKLEENLASGRGNLGVSQLALDDWANKLRSLISVRAQMLGLSIDQLSEKQRAAPLGYSPETAITAPDHAYLMMGDNSPQSLDSRCWGWVPAENLRGRVLAVILPFHRWRLVR